MRLSRIFVAVVSCTVALPPTANCSNRNRLHHRNRGRFRRRPRGRRTCPVDERDHQTGPRVHTSENGTFIFPDLFPADYDLRVTHPGFKTYIQNGITLGTLEKVDLHSIRLEVGDVALPSKCKRRRHAS